LAPSAFHVRAKHKRLRLGGESRGCHCRGLQSNGPETQRELEVVRYRIPPRGGSVARQRAMPAAATRRDVGAGQACGTYEQYSASWKVGLLVSTGQMLVPGAPPLPCSLWQTLTEWAVQEQRHRLVPDGEREITTLSRLPLADRAGSSLCTARQGRHTLPAASSLAINAPDMQ